MAKRLIGLRARMWLFYVKLLQGKKGRLSFNIIREASSYIPDFLLPQVTPTFLRFFHGSVWGPQIPLRTPIQADNTSNWVSLDDGRLFCCCGGGGNSQTGLQSKAWKVSYLLSCNGDVEELPDLLTARKYHGVIQVVHVYVFGGICKL